MSNTELGAINSAPTGGTTPVENSTYQSYSYTFTATQAQEELSLLFRNDPGFTWLDSVSVVKQGDTSGTNLLTNGNFEAGGQPDASSTPIGWDIIGAPTLGFSGALGTAANSLDQTATPHDGSYMWVDGATQGYDGIAQQMNLNVGATYTVSFELAVDINGQPPDTNGANNGVDTQVWVGSTAQNDPAPCFCQGTRILTLRGEVAVEALAVGDLVVTLGGKGAVLKPIIWIGSTSFDTSLHPRPHEVQPVRIRAGALGEGLPHRDLLVSPGHSLLIDGVLIQAERLVNGATVVRDCDMTRGQYFHVELDGHDILLSEGVPTESYLDTGNRKVFLGSNRLTDLYPDFSPRHWTETCVALVQEGPVLTTARERLIQRAEQLGWLRADEPAPVMLIDGAAVSPTRRDGTRWLYAIPAGARSAHLVSAAAVPAEIQPCSRDRRRLGLWIDGIAIVRHGTRQDLALDGPALTEGWHDIECVDGGPWRWTDGDASIAVQGPCELEVSVGCCLPTWQESTDHFRLQPVAAAA